MYAAVAVGGVEIALVALLAEADAAERELQQARVLFREPRVGDLAELGLDFFVSPGARVVLEDRQPLAPRLMDERAGV